MKTVRSKSALVDRHGETLLVAVVPFAARLTAIVKTQATILNIRYMFEGFNLSFKR